MTSQPERPLKVIADETDSRLDELEAWRIKHMSECHPQILTWQAKMWGKWLWITGIVGGFLLIVGYVLGALIQWLPGR